MKKMNNLFVAHETINDTTKILGVFTAEDAEFLKERLKENGYSEALNEETKKYSRTFIGEDQDYEYIYSITPWLSTDRPDSPDIMTSAKWHKINLEDDDYEEYKDFEEYNE